MNKDFRVNESILRPVNGVRVRDVRLIDEEGQPVGILNVREALELARSKGLDLIEVAPQAQPPVCKVGDYGKIRYEQGKREREQHKKQRQQEIKGIKMRPVTADHDFQVRVKHAQEFLEKGDKVKVTIQFKAREITHPEIGRRLMEKMIAATSDVAVVEKPTSIEGKMMTAILAPKNAPVA